MFTAEASASLGGPDWLLRVRAAAFERYSAEPLPTEAEEVWRYSRIDDLDLDQYDPAVTGDAQPPLSVLVSEIGEPAALITTVNGRIVSVEGDRPGLSVSTLSAHPDGPERLGAVAPAQDAFGHLAQAFLADACVIDVRGVVDGPVVVRHHISGEGAAAFPRLIVRAAGGGQAQVIEVTTSGPDRVLVVPVTELDVEDGGILAHVSVQHLGRSAWQIAHASSRVGRDAELRSFAVALGGDYARLRTDSRLVGRGGTSKLRAVYFGSGEQMHDFRTLQDHDAQSTTSDLLFKGAVTDTARGVYTGMIRVRKGASGTNAFQTNRNLVLAEGAHADSVPNLEIEDNDVRCSHASAVGPVDEDQLYYLESRGVPTSVAQKLIVLGFFDEVLAELPASGLRSPLRAEIAELAGMGK